MVWLLTVGRGPGPLTLLQAAMVTQQAAYNGPAPVYSANFTVKGRKVTGNQNGLAHRVLPQRPSDHSVMMSEKNGQSTRIWFHL